MDMEWINYIVSILSGLAVAIPLVIKLVQYIKIAVKEKNWSRVVQLIINLMSEAETKFENGYSRKEWVLHMLETSAKTVNFDMDIEVIDGLIDSLCEMSKNVNVKKSLK